MLKNFTAKGAMIFFPIFCKGWMRVQTIRPHSLLTLENEEMLMKLLLRADIQEWQKGMFWSAGLVLWENRSSWTKFRGEVHTWAHPCPCVAKVTETLLAMKGKEKP